ncbi:Molybdate-anion transporter [Bienertia sinuspersici]
MSCRGHKKFCLLFSILHLIMGVWKTLAAHPTIWIASICLSLASSIFSFSFETWMVVDHDKQGYRQDALNDTFWLMTFFESTSFIASQVLANWALGYGSKKSLVSPSVITTLLAALNLAITGRWSESPARGRLKEHRAAFFAYIVGDKRIWLLGCAQACLHFSVAVFWILWASTIVADGREVQLGLMYPCFLGARVLGSTAFPWTLSGLLSLRIEDCLLYEFIFTGFSRLLLLMITRYLNIFTTSQITMYLAFLLFNSKMDVITCNALISGNRSFGCNFLLIPGCCWPDVANSCSAKDHVFLSLPFSSHKAHSMRNKPVIHAIHDFMYVPNELRAGMISLSLAPANAAILFVLFQGAYYRNVNNSTIIAFAALSLFLAAGCMHMLKNLGKQPHQSWHKQ